MRLLLLSEYFPSSEQAELKGGVEARCFSIAQELAKRHDVEVITSFQGGPRLDEVGEVIVHRVGMRHPYASSGALLSRLSFVRAAAGKGRDLPCDIVDGCNFLSYLPAHRIARTHGARSVATYHDVWAGGEWLRHTGLLTGVLGELWERRSLSLPWDRIIAVSEHVRVKLSARGIPAERVSVVPNGIDFPALQELKAAKSAAPSICCVARLVPYKRLDVLVRAMAIVSREVPDATCHIIGTGPERHRLEHLIHEHGLSGKVTLRGFLPRHDDVLEAMKSSWVFCLPSEVEGFGISVLEALGCGTPVVCSDIPALREATGTAATLVPPGDATALAAALVDHLRDGKLRARKARDGKAHASRFDWPRIAGEVERIYSALTGTKQ